MMTSISLLSPLVDQWRQLREGTRDGIIAGVVVAVIESAVRFFPVSNLYDQDDAGIIVYGVNHSIVTLADAVFLFSRKFFATLRTGIAG